MNKEIVPGHVKAYTLPEALIGAIATWFFTQSLIAVVGVELMILGGFLGNQTTHLKQHHTSEWHVPPPTWIERMMILRPRFFKFVGMLYFVVGIAAFCLGAAERQFGAGYFEGHRAGFKDGWNMSENPPKLND